MFLKKYLHFILELNTLLPGIYAVSDNSGEVQKRCDIISGSFCLGNVCLPITGSIQYTKNNGKTPEIASQLHVHWRLKSVRVRIPETEISDNETCIVRMTYFVSVHQIKRY